MNTCLQANEYFKVLGHHGWIFAHTLGERSPAYPIKYDTRAGADLLHASDGGNGKSQKFYRRMVRRFAECSLLCPCRPIEFHHARAPLEHFCHVSGRDQWANGFIHLEHPYPLLRRPAARPLMVRWMPVTTSSFVSTAR